MDGKPFCVYEHRNKSNGKVYIGITSMQPEKRWLNGDGYKKNEKFYKDIKKYGWSGFDHKILCDGIRKDDAVSIEERLIDENKSVANGYNIDSGGRYGEKGYLSHIANGMKNGVKKHIGSLPYADVLYDIMECANDCGGSEARAINRFVDCVLECGYGCPRKFEFASDAINCEDEMFVAWFIYEMRYLFSLQEWIVGGQVGKKHQHKMFTQTIFEILES